MYEPLRNADLATLASMLQDQSARRLDLVSPARAMHPVITAQNSLAMYVDHAEASGVDEQGHIVYAMADPILVTVGDVMLEGFATRLGIPMRYLRRMINERPSLAVDNIAGWLDHQPDEMHMIRTFRTDAEGVAFGRALLSPRFEHIDNFDVLLGLLDGVRAACPSAQFQHADLTDRKMSIRIVAEDISTNIADLLHGYQPTFGGRTLDEYPLLFAGLFVTNSETGDAAYSIGPRAIVQVCTNGMTRSVDALRRVHLGSRLEEGVVTWSDETRQNQIALIRSQTADAVRTFLSIDYLEQRFVEDMRQANGIAIASHQAIAVAENITTANGFSDAERNSILSAWMDQSTRLSALDLASALTRAAQSFDDSERASFVEDNALSLATAAVRAVA